MGFQTGSGGGRILKFDPSQVVGNDSDGPLLALAGCSIDDFNNVSTRRQLVLVEGRGIDPLSVDVHLRPSPAQGDI